MDAQHTTRCSLSGVLGGLLAAAALLAGSPRAAPAAPAPQVITVYVFPDSMHVIQSPDGKFHDAFVPSSFVLHAGTPVRLTIVNDDDMPHTITA